ncbi:hypothetical protein RSA31_19765 [Pantoea dispersa]|nr:hypothetical protein NS215_16670 [Pantoea dispersa]KTS86091.1 hypothetical protein RSA31_19765 [Pantoea dispersa]
MIQLISNFLQVKKLELKILIPAVVLFPTKGDRFFCILETIPDVMMRLLKMERKGSDFILPGVEH